MNPRRGSPSFIVLQRVGVVAVIGELKPQARSIAKLADLPLQQPRSSILGGLRKELAAGVIS